MRQYTRGYLRKGVVKGFMLRRLLSIGLILVGLSILFNLGKQTFTLWRADSRIKEARDRVLVLRTENEKLTKDLEYYRTDDFIEREARNKLNFVRPGEVIVLLPSPTPTPTHASLPSIPNWQKWSSLFFD